MTAFQGRRLPDTLFGNLPGGNLQPGDYWKCIDESGFPMHSHELENLTGTIWQVLVPGAEAYAVATLTKHTVREEDDGTISVRAGDGSSNSILVTHGSDETTYHGYIEHGVWTSV